MSRYQNCVAVAKVGRALGRREDQEMRWLDVRRHSLTKKGDARGSGSHLSQAGVALAQRVGAGLEGITRVVVSQSPRTSETALAMGFAVDESVDMGSGYIAGEVSHHERWTWADPFSRYAALVAEGRGLAAFATEGPALWRRTVEEISDGDAALIIGHGGSIEPCLVACFRTPSTPNGADRSVTVTVRGFVGTTPNL